MQNKITKDNIKFAFLAFMEQIAYIEFVCYWHPSSASTPVDITATETTGSFGIYCVVVTPC